MNSKRVIIWTFGIDDLINGNGLVGGITVQMMHWANVFVKNGWQVISFTRTKEQNNNVLNNIKFKYLKKASFLNILFEPFIIFYCIFKIRPTIIITRGASRSQFALVLASKILRVKLILMLASDTDVKKGEELISDSWDRVLFRLGLRNTQYIIAQNANQQSLVNTIGSKNSVIIIPNIWDSTEPNSINEENSILWVSNFRKLKRPEWFLDLARKLPQYNFTMIGSSLDHDLYRSCKNQAKDLKNVEFLGSLSFQETESLFAQHKLLVCTSKIEGFPNTFLQAWANRTPVITSFDPSDVVKNKNLGISYDSLEEANNAISTLLTDDEKYYKMQNSINAYFKAAHDSQVQYQQLIRMIAE